MALAYFVIAVGMGVFMGATHDHRLMSVHAHLNLLGWVTMTLIAIIYHFFPAQARSRVAKAQFWLHQIGLPGMMVTLGLRIYGNEAAGNYIGMFSLLTMASVLLFAGNIVTAMLRAPGKATEPTPRATALGAAA
jgi:cbb3-type cytochrome oxidase subunit 3